MCLSFPLQPVNWHSSHVQLDTCIYEVCNICLLLCCGGVVGYFIELVPCCRTCTSVGMAMVTCQDYVHLRRAVAPQCVCECTQWEGGEGGVDLQLVESLPEASLAGR